MNLPILPDLSSVVITVSILGFIRKPLEQKNLFLEIFHSILILRFFKKNIYFTDSLLYNLKQQKNVLSHSINCVLFSEQC